MAVAVAGFSVVDIVKCVRVCRESFGEGGGEEWGLNIARFELHGLYSKGSLATITKDDRWQEC